jgi:hypothetical protein
MDKGSFVLNSDLEDAKNMEIWEDHMTMFVLEGNQLPEKCVDAGKN